MTQSGPMYCLRHPDVETGLRCGKCDDPICARCLVHTNVGARCSKCANVRKPILYEVSGTLLYKAVGAALVVSIVGGVLLGFLTLSGIGGSLWISTLLFAGLGYAIGEVVSLAANRRRGRTLQVIVSAGIVIAVIATTLTVDAFILWWLFGIIVAFLVGLNRVR
ncbi:MAG: hypothetical protein O2854_07935 [Chloroflexi bacterium]|nr:hypothetical protein [Chloroflexota bacterium]